MSTSFSRIVRLAVEGLVLVPFLAGLALAVPAGGFDYDSRLVYDFCAPDQVASHEGGTAEWGYYQQYETHNGTLTGPGTFTLAPWNTCLANPDYTYLLWKGSGSVTFSLRAAADDGKGSNNPGPWGDWVKVTGDELVKLVGDEHKREIPAEMDGKQFLQCKVELGQGASLRQLEIHKAMTLPDHPRIYLTAAKVEEVKKRIAEDPESKKLYEHYLRFMLGRSRSGDMLKNTNTWTLGWWMTSVGVAWNLSQDPVLLEEARAELARMETPWGKGLGHFEHQPSRA